MTDRLADMRVFVAVAEAAGFAAAARRLGLSPPAVTRAVAALEARIGTPLLHRTTRVVRLSEAGERYLLDCRRILAAVAEAEASAAGLHAGLRGPLAVTAPVLFGRRYVAPLLRAFLASHEEVAGRLFLVDRVVDLLEEGLDVALRIAHLPDSSLTAVRLGEVRRVVCASPDYLARRGEPGQPAEVQAHEVVAFGQGEAGPDWRFGGPGRVQVVTPRPRLTVNNADVAIAAALAGEGLTRVLSYQSAAEVRAGRLRIVLREFEPPPIPVHLVHATGRNASARIRAFVDFAVPRLRAEPDWA